MNQDRNTEIRRHGNIVAFREGSGPTVAFHAYNMQVAEISDEIWNQLPSTRFDLAEKVEVQSPHLNAATQELVEWEQSTDVARSLEKDRNKFNLTLNITQLCNLHCHYCAAGGDGTYGDPVVQISVQKTLPQIERLMSRLSPGGEFNITFLGGEPLMYPQALKSIAVFTRELAERIGVITQFQIITNATLITHEVLDLLTPLRPTVTVSLDGPPEINDNQRPQKNGDSSTEKALAGLKLLLDRKRDFGLILLHSVFNRQNTEVLKVWEYFQSLPIDRMEFTFDVTEKDENANLAFVEGMKSVARKAYKLGGETELRRLQYFDIYFSQLDQQFRRENHCGSGKSLLSLDSRNQLYLCPLEVSFKDRLIGNEESINWDRLKSLEKPLIELNNCGACWARHLCGGGCMFNHESLTGEKHVKHPTYCFRTRHLLSEVLLYYKTLRESESLYENL